MKLTIDLNKFIIFVAKIFNYLFKKTTQKMETTTFRQTTDAYNDAIEAKADLDLAVQTAQANLKPYQDALDLAIKAQADNITLSEGLKAQIISDLVPVTPVVPASETEITV